MTRCPLTRWLALAVAGISACTGEGEPARIDVPIVRYCFRIGVYGEDSNGERQAIFRGEPTAQVCLCASLADFGEHDVRGDTLERWANHCSELAKAAGLTDEECFERAELEHSRMSLVDVGECDASEYDL